jgi:hypothetical protein
VTVRETLLMARMISPFVRVSRVRPPRGSGAVCLAAALGLSGCGVSLPDYPERPVSSYPSRQTQGDVTVAAHAVVDPIEARRYFHSDLVSDGILPMLVVIENRDPQASYVISKEQCAVVDPTRVTTGEVVDDQLAAAALASPVVPLPIAGDVAILNNENALENFESKEMKLLTISPEEKIQGFVYFRIRRGESKLWEQRALRVRLRKAGTEEVVEFSLPLTPSDPQH